MNDIELTLMCVAAFLGMLTVATLGYVNREKKEDFKKGKFLSSVLRGLIIVLGGALTFPTTFPSTIGVLQYITAYLIGAGVDTVGHNASKAVGVSERLP